MYMYTTNTRDLSLSWPARHGAEVEWRDLAADLLKFESETHHPRKELYLYFSHQPPEHIPVVYERQWNPTV